MKGIDMFCASQASTAVCNSSNMDQPSSSSDPSCSSSAGILLGCRAIDRHNPIIGDHKRNPRSLPAALCISQSPPISPKPVSSYQLLHKSSNTKKGTSKNKSSNDQTTKVDHKEPNDPKPRKSSSNPITDQESASTTLAKHVVSKRWSAAAAVSGDLFTPPGSSRYILGHSAYFNGLSDNYDPVLSVANPVGSNRSSSQALIDLDDSAHRKQPAVAPSERPSNQVVVLRVSLHCKGCEGKLRKHLSRMEGVTSYSIDLKAKKVTIVGDVTPFSVLASVSKVKNAQFWTSTTSTPVTASNN